MNGLTFFAAAVLLLQLSGVAAAQQPTSGATGHHKSSTRVIKGAIVGAAIGATAAIIGGAALCDGSHCATSGYVVLGILGGGLGAAAGAGIASIPEIDARPVPLRRAGYARGLFVRVPFGRR